MARRRIWISILSIVFIASAMLVFPRRKSEERLKVETPKPAKPIMIPAPPVPSVPPGNPVESPKEPAALIPAIPAMLDINGIIQEAFQTLECKDVSEIRKMAFRLRQAARADKSCRQRLASIVLDARGRTDISELAAFVLGGLPDEISRQAIAQALAHATETDWKVLLIYAYGAPEAEDPDGYFEQSTFKTPIGLAVRMDRGIIDDDGFRQILRLFINERGSPVRSAALRRLGLNSATKTEILEAYLGALETEEDLKIKGAIAVVLSKDFDIRPRLGDRQAASNRELILRAILAQGQIPANIIVRQMSGQLLGTSIRSTLEVLAVAELLESLEPDVRRWALSILGERSHHPRIDLEDPGWRRVREAADQMAADDPEPAVRATALDALVKFRESVPKNRWLSALDDKDWSVRIAAVRLIGQAVFGGKETIERLQKLKEDDERPEVKNAANEALKWMGYW